MKQIFTILWVEDKPKTMKGQVKRIKKYLSDKEFEPNLNLVETGENVKEIMQGENVDIVVVDKNITEDVSGIDIVRTIREEKFLTDILFYSAIRFNRDEILNQTGHYGYIKIIEGKEIEEPLKKLIDKNIRRCQDIVFLRGMIISRMVDLELKINDFFIRYFRIPKDTQEEFYDFVLENKYSTLISKTSALSAIIKKQGIRSEFKHLTKDIEELFNKRNLVAHCKTDPGNKNVLISMGKPNRFDKKALHEILKKTNRVSERLDELIARFT